MTYQPEPIDTAGVELPADVVGLRELLAKHAHDIWARERLSKGWKFGPQRNDARLEHPCLIPYEDLPDAEKQYDRNAAMDTLKAIVKLGFEIRQGRVSG